MRSFGRGLLTLALILLAHPGLTQNSELDINQLRETLLFGPEVTFTNEILTDISHSTTVADRGRHKIPFTAQTLPTVMHQLTQGEQPFTPAQVREIIRFLTDVLQVSQGTLHLHYTKQIEPVPPPLPLPSRYAPSTQHKVHKQPITFEVRLPNDVPAIVTLEPGCIEVNQAPAHFEDLEPVWGEIFQRAQAQNFVGNMFGPTGESIGGGGHLHLGFQNNAESVFFTHPLVLQRLLLLPLKYPGIMYMLHDREDFGPDSSVRTPFERESSKNVETLRFLWGLEHLVHLSPRARQWWFQNKIPLFSTMHDQHISLKGFSNKDFRVEIRFQRAYNTLEDLQAIAEFWIRSLVALSQGATTEVVPPNFEKSADFYGTRPTTLIAQFKSWLTGIGMPRSYRHKLLHFGGDQTLEGIPVVDQTHPVFKHIKAYPLMGDPMHIFSYEVLIPIPPSLEKYIDELEAIDSGNHHYDPHLVRDLVHDRHRKYVSLVMGEGGAVPYRHDIHVITLRRKHDPKTAHSIVLTLIHNQAGKLSMRVASHVSQFLRTPQRLFDAYLNAGFFRSGLWQDQLKDAGLSSEKFQHLQAALPPQRTVSITWELAVTSSNEKKIDAIRAIAVNGFILPYQLFETGQVNLYVIRYQPPADNAHPHDLLVSALDDKNEPLFAMISRSKKPTPFGPTATYHLTDEPSSRYEGLSFYRKEIANLLSVPLGEVFDRTILLKTLRLFWNQKKDIRKTYEAIRRFERRLKRCGR